MRGIEKAHVDRYGGKNKGVKREERTRGGGGCGGRRETEWMVQDIPFSTEEMKERRELEKSGQERGTGR